MVIDCSAIAGSELTRELAKLAEIAKLARLMGIIGLGWGMVLADQGRRLAERREQEANAATIAETKAKQDALASKQKAIASQHQAEQSSLEARVAEQSARESELDTKAFSDFLVNDILSAARPEGERGGLGIGVTVREALEEALKLRRAKFGPGDSETLKIMVQLDLLYIATKQSELRVSNLIELVSQLEKQSKSVSGQYRYHSTRIDKARKVR